MSFRFSDRRYTNNDSTANTIGVTLMTPDSGRSINSIQGATMKTTIVMECLA